MGGGIGCPGGWDFLSKEPCATRCPPTTIHPELPSALSRQRSTGSPETVSAGAGPGSFLPSFLPSPLSPAQGALSSWSPRGGEQALSPERHRERGAGSRAAGGSQTCVLSPRDARASDSEQPQILGQLLLWEVLTPLPGPGSNWAEWGQGLAAGEVAGVPHVFFPLLAPGTGLARSPVRMGLVRLRGSVPLGRCRVRSRPHGSPQLCGCSLTRASLFCRISGKEILF